MSKIVIMTTKNYKWILVTMLLFVGGLMIFNNSTYLPNTAKIVNFKIFLLEVRFITEKVGLAINKA